MSIKIGDFVTDKDDNLWMRAQGDLFVCVQGKDPGHTHNFRPFLEANIPTTTDLQPAYIEIVRKDSPRKRFLTRTKAPNAKSPYSDELFSQLQAYKSQASLCDFYSRRNQNAQSAWGQLLGGRLF